MDASFEKKYLQTRRLIFVELPLWAILLMVCFATFPKLSLLIPIGMVALVLSLQQRAEAILCDVCGTPVWKTVYFGKRKSCVGCSEDEGKTFGLKLWKDL
jgi:hypothetical protein